MDRVQVQVLANADEDNSLAHLWNAKPLSIEQPGSNAIPTSLQRPQHLDEPALGGALHEAAYVLGDERLRSEPAQQPNVFVEQRLIALRRPVLVGFFVAPAFFALARRRKRLAWWGTVEQVQFASGETCRLEDLFRLSRQSRMASLLMFARYESCAAGTNSLAQTTLNPAMR